MSNLHCWADGPEEIIEEPGDDPCWWLRLHPIGSTCLLPDGHEGEHEFTPDSQISVSFAPDTPELDGRRWVEYPR